MHRSSPPRLASVIAVVAAMTVSLGAHPAASAEPLKAPIVNAGHPDAVPGSFIVVLRDGPGTASTESTESTVAAMRQRHGLDLRFVYTAALNGFAVHNATARQLRRLGADPAVAYIEQDLKVGVTLPSEIAFSDDLSVPECWPDPPCHEEAAQFYPPSWHLDRISQRNLPMNNRYEYASTGLGVRAYVIGTGLRPSHNDFGGRARSAFDYGNDIGPPRDDCHGHGTQLAGILGGSAFGVAKQVSLVGVRVLDCTGMGTVAAVITGINWVNEDSRRNPGLNVAVMGLGGDKSAAMNDAIAGSVAADVHYSVPAGHTSSDACNFSPGSATVATVVAATTSVDARPSYSNFGTCVDVFAPGNMLTAPWMTSDNATSTISGTTVAAAVVAGVVAMWRQQFPAMTVAQLSAALSFYATRGVLTNVGAGSPNLLLYTRMYSG